MNEGSGWDHGVSVEVGVVRDGGIAGGWRSGVVLPIWRGRGDPVECGTYGEIGLLGHPVRVVEGIFEHSSAADWGWWCAVWTRLSLLCVVLKILWWRLGKWEIMRSVHCRSVTRQRPRRQQEACVEVQRTAAEPPDQSRTDPPSQHTTEYAWDTHTWHYWICMRHTHTTLTEH